MTLLNRVYYYISYSKCQTVIDNVSFGPSRRLHFSMGDELKKTPPFNNSLSFGHSVC